MIGKIIAAVAGAKVAERSGKIGGASGALMGVAASSLVRRLSVPAMLAIAAGGYAASKLGRRGGDRQPEPAAPKPAAKRKPRKTANPG